MKKLLLILMLALGGCVSCEHGDVKGVDCVVCEKTGTIGGVAVSCNWK